MTEDMENGIYANSQDNNNQDNTDVPKNSTSENYDSVDTSNPSLKKKKLKNKI